MLSEINQEEKEKHSTISCVHEIEKAHLTHRDGKRQLADTGEGGSRGKDRDGLISG